MGYDSGGVVQVVTESPVAEIERRAPTGRSLSLQRVVVRRRTLGMLYTLPIQVLLVSHIIEKHFGSILGWLLFAVAALAAIGIQWDRWTVTEQEICRFSTTERSGKIRWDEVTAIERKPQGNWIIRDRSGMELSFDPVEWIGVLAILNRLFDLGRRSSPRRSEAIPVEKAFLREESTRFWIPCVFLLIGALAIWMFAARMGLLWEALALGLGWFFFAWQRGGLPVRPARIEVNDLGIRVKRGSSITTFQWSELRVIDFRSRDPKWGVILVDADRAEFVYGEAVFEAVKQIGVPRAVNASVYTAPKVLTTSGQLI